MFYRTAFFAGFFLFAIICWTNRIDVIYEGSTNISLIGLIVNIFYIEAFLLYIFIPARLLIYFAKIQLIADPGPDQKKPKSFIQELGYTGSLIFLSAIVLYFYFYNYRSNDLIFTSFYKPVFIIIAYLIYLLVATQRVYGNLRDDFFKMKSSQLPHRWQLQAFLYVISSALSAPFIYPALYIIMIKTLYHIYTGNVLINVNNVFFVQFLFVIAALVAGLAEEAFQQQGFPHELRWLKLSLFVYALPVGALYLFSCFFVIYLTYERHLDFRWLYPWILLGAIVLMAMICTLRCFRRRDRTEAFPDPKRWFLDEGTGEYHRITGYYGGRVIYSSQTYAERFSDYDQHTMLRTKIYIRVALYLIAFVTATIVFLFNQTRSFPLLESMAIYCAAGAGMFWFGLSILREIPRAIREFFVGFGHEVGPRPVSRPGRAEVETQQAYGNAGAATINDIHRALSGKSTGSSGARAGHGPIYDE